MKPVHYKLQCSDAIDDVIYLGCLKEYIGGSDIGRLKR